MYETLVFDPRVIWPDTLALAGDGYLYVINNQLNRQPRFHHGQIYGTDRIACYV